MQSMADQEQSSSVELRCVDLARFTVPAPLALRSGLVAAAVGAGERVVELPRDVSGDGVATAVAYWKGRAAADADVREFEREFARGLGHDARIDLIHAAHHLKDKGLYNLVVGLNAN